MPSEQQPKDKLEGLVQDSERKSREIVRRAGDFLQFGQYTADLADASLKVIQYPLPPNIDLASKTRAWQYLNEQQDNILASMPVSIQPVISSGSNVAYEMTDLANPNNLIWNVPIEERDKARDEAKQLGEVIDRFANKERVLALLRQFELDRAVQGQKSPAERFEIAWAAFERPVTDESPAITSLLAIRECINGTIEALLRRRPKQEPTGNERKKIESICNQLAWDGVLKGDDIKRLACRWYSLVDELSDSKKRDYSREEWQASLRRATLFLKDFLESLDPAKMKSRRRK